MDAKKMIAEALVTAATVTGASNAAIQSVQPPATPAEQTQSQVEMLGDSHAADKEAEQKSNIEKANAAASSTPSSAEVRSK
jgi:hypothetical protein